MQGVLCPWSPWGGYGGGDPLADPPVTLEGLLGGKVPQAGGALDGLLGSTIFLFRFGAKKIKVLSSLE